MNTTSPRTVHNVQGSCMVQWYPRMDSYFVELSMIIPSMGSYFIELNRITPERTETLLKTTEFPCMDGHIVKHCKITPEWTATSLSICCIKKNAMKEIPLYQ